MNHVVLRQAIPLLVVFLLFLFYREVVLILFLTRFSNKHITFSGSMSYAVGARKVIISETLVVKLS